MKKIAIIGRPNVGKSTLFNRLIGRRTSIVENHPGVTRDRLYARISYGQTYYILIDTGGLFADSSVPLTKESKEQTLMAVKEADLILIVLDGRSGPFPHDREILNLARPFLKPIVCAVNKIEGRYLNQSFVEFYQLGVDQIFPISAEMGTGIDDLLEAVEKLLPEESVQKDSSEIEIFSKVAVLGRPNVGKSTFINYLLGENRMIASPVPGTTRDAIDSLVCFHNRNYIIIDTAGIRRRGKIGKGVERASVIRADESIQAADIVFILIDAGEGITDQDIKLVGRVVEEGKGFVIIVNKWDLKNNIPRAQEQFEKDLINHFSFIKEIPFLFLSSKEGFNQTEIYRTINEIMQSYTKRISTSEINQFLETTLKKYPPPLYRKKPVKINYATQGAIKPPTFIFFTNFKEGVTRSYQKFLENSLRSSFGFKGTPVKLLFKQKKNIFKNTNS